MVTQVIAAFYKAFGQTFIKEMINRIFFTVHSLVQPYNRVFRLDCTTANN